MTYPTMTPTHTPPLPVTGRCHCGAVQLRALVDASRVFVCHCVDCQVLTGSAYRVVVPAVAGSCEVSGPVSRYARRADSGAVRYQVFCPTCGTPLMATGADAQGLATLRVGVLDQRAGDPGQPDDPRPGVSSRETQDQRDVRDQSVADPEHGRPGEAAAASTDEDRAEDRCVQRHAP